MNTRAFANAIRACSQAGGGTVVVPPGAWLTGPIRLEDNVNLHLQRGALLQFSSNIDDFPLIAGFRRHIKKFIVTPPLVCLQGEKHRDHRGWDQSTVRAMHGAM